MVTFGVLQGFVVYLLSGGFFHHEISFWEFAPGWAADGVNSVSFKFVDDSLTLAENELFLAQLLFQLCHSSPSPMLSSWVL